MAKSLVIVESPAKAKTINKFLGRNYTVKASMGHVRDLPTKSLAVDVEKNFAPKYEVVPGRKKILDELKKAAKTSSAIFLAADPDREGEAICWHLAHELKAARKPVHRVMFNEITKRAVTEAFTHPGSIDKRKVYAQQARRILDRLVGYKISPLLWEKVRRGISAGRVQSVALRLVVDREKEIRAFVPVEYWTITARLARPDGSGPEFPARLAKVDGEKATIPSQETADAIYRELQAPGTAYRYSNTGYVLLGMVIEKASGQTYARYLDAQLFKPLGLRQTSYCPSHTADPAFALGYSKDSTRIVRAKFLHLSIGPINAIGLPKLTLFSGFDLERIAYLVALCFSFLFFVVLNGWVKQLINTVSYVNSIFFETVLCFFKIEFFY